MIVSSLLMSLIAATAQPAAEEEAPAQEATQTSQKATEKQICRRIRLNGDVGARGANFPTKKVCKTKAEWEAERKR